MEFKVFKNENNKILKEYWLTQSEWEALDKTTVQEGDIYHIVGTIDKGDLSADVNASLAKADNSLQKPTATLAKESFVKVGIDGTQNFDENSYVVAPSVDGTAGQVLKKTASGTEWANESGGGKLYIHRVSLKSSLFADNEYYITIPSSDATPITTETANRLLYGYVEQIDGSDKAYHSCTVKKVVIYESSNEIEIDGTKPTISFLAAIETDTVLER